MIDGNYGDWLILFINNIEKPELTNPVSPGFRVVIAKLLNVPSKVGLFNCEETYSSIFLSSFFLIVVSIFFHHYMVNIGAKGALPYTKGMIMGYEEEG